jgi:hypothetical protein
MEGRKPERPGGDSQAMTFHGVRAVADLKSPASTLCPGNSPGDLNFFCAAAWLRILYKQAVNR